jgi:hypothetical protein
MRTGRINILQQNIRPTLFHYILWEMNNVLEVDDNETFKIKK